MEIPKYIVFRVDVMRKGTSVELTNITDEVEDVILKADRKTENSSEKPNNSTIPKMEQVDEPQTPMCETCRHDEPNNPKCDECIAGEDKPSNYEPQTDCPWR